MPRWRVVQTKPHAERWALQNLIQQGYVAYLPLFAVRRRDRAMRTMWLVAHVPLFSGYLFVSLGNEHWTPITGTQGVSRLILDNGKPACVPHGVVEAIQAGETARRTIPAEGTTWAPGAACKTANGIDAVVIGQRDGRTLVGIFMLGEVREVLVDSDSLVARE